MMGIECRNDVVRVIVTGALPRIRDGDAHHRN